MYLWWWLNDGQILPCYDWDSWPLLKNKDYMIQVFTNSTTVPLHWVCPQSGRQRSKVKFVRIFTGCGHDRDLVARYKDCSRVMTKQEQTINIKLFISDYPYHFIKTSDLCLNQDLRGLENQALQCNNTFEPHCMGCPCNLRRLGGYNID